MCLQFRFDWIDEMIAHTARGGGVGGGLSHRKNSKRAVRVAGNHLFFMHGHFVLKECACHSNPMIRIGRRALYIGVRPQSLGKIAVDRFKPRWTDLARK